MDIVERLTNKPEPCRRYSAEDDALRSEAAATITALRARVEELEREKAESDLAFDLRWDADMRAIKRWQVAHPGNDLVWPDHAELCLWLLTELERANPSALAALRAKGGGNGDA